MELNIFMMSPITQGIGLHNMIYLPRQICNEFQLLYIVKRLFSVSVYLLQVLNSYLIEASYCSYALDFLLKWTVQRCFCP